MTSPVDLRDEYRRRLQRRQSTVIGGTLAAMAVVTIISLLVWSGMLPALYDPEFSSSRPSLPAEPCPPQDATTLALSDVTVSVYNSTTTSGLAAYVSGALQGDGLAITTVADWPQGAFPGNVKLVISPAGLVNAYTVKQMFTGPVHIELSDQVPADSTDVWIVLGEAFSRGIISQEEAAALEAGTPIVAPEGCVAPADAESSESGDGTEDSGEASTEESGTA